MTDYEKNLFETRYRKDESEKSWNDIFKRVANTIGDTKEKKKSYYELMSEGYFIPSSPQLWNFGVYSKNGSSCFTMHIGDTLEEIYQADWEACQVYKQSGGCGYNLSGIRPRGSIINGSPNKSVGIIPVLERLERTTAYITAGGRSRGALMCQLDISHPDVLEFITCKKPLKLSVNNTEQWYIPLQNVNISVRCSDEFMEAVENDKSWILHWSDNKQELTIKTWEQLNNNLRLDPNDWKDVNRQRYVKYILDPIFDKYKGNIKAKQLWDLICELAHDSADPGVVFTGNIEKYNPHPQLGKLHSNPCQTAWAKVLTPEGIREFKDIGIGSVIWSKEGWTTVVNKWSNGVKPVYKYETTSSIFYGTENHKVISNGEKVEVKEAESIDSLRGVYHTEFTINPEDVMDGLVIGDGSKHEASGNLLLLHIGENDYDYFDSEIKDLIEKYRPGIGKTCYKIKTTITSEELPKTYERRVPERYIKNKNKLVGFLRGLYSANGSVCGNRITLKSSSKGLIEDVQLMLSSVGIKSYYTTNKATKVKFSNGEYLCKQSYDLNISTDKERFVNLIGFIQIYKNEKIILQDTKKEKVSYDIINVEYLGNEEVFDITVDNKSHTYWTQGCDVSNCSEFLGPDYSSCNLGSMNLRKFFVKESFNWDLYSEKIQLAVEYLNDVLDYNELPIEQINEVTHNITRPIGLGIMKLADLLILENIKYGSKEAIEYTENLMAFTTLKAWQKSFDLSKSKKLPSSWNKDRMSDIFSMYSSNSKVYEKEYLELKNLVDNGAIATNTVVTSIAPTGSIAQICSFINGYTGESSGIEPIFSWNTYRKDASGSTTVKHDLAPKDKKEYYHIIADEVSPEEHIRMQAAASKFTSMSVSKTINLIKEATIKEVNDAYILAWKLGIKGTTVYRDGSKPIQVLSSLDKKDNKEINLDEFKIPEIDVMESEDRPDRIYGLTEKIPVANGHIFLTMNKMLSEEDYWIVRNILQNRGKLMEVFINYGKSGTDVSGYLQAIGRLISLDLRKGNGKISLDDILDAIEGISFSPSWYKSKLTQSPIDVIVKSINRERELREKAINKGKETKEDKKVKKEFAKEICSICGQEYRYTDGCKSCKCSSKCG